MATIDVIEQSDIDRDTAMSLHAVVAIDDAWALMLFSLLAAFALGLDGGNRTLELLGHGLWEIFGAVALGIALGLPMGYLSGRLKPGEPTLVEALGMIFLTAGLAIRKNSTMIGHSTCSISWKA